MNLHRILQRLFLNQGSSNLALLCIMFIYTANSLNPECPRQCHCVLNRMNCELSGLKQLPSPYLPQLEYLLVENQTFTSTHLGPAELIMYKSPEFGGQVRLKSLYIRSCNIRTVGKRAFEALGSRLEVLDLSGNPLTLIGAYAFAGLGHLTLILDRINQPIFDDHSFSGLSKMKSLIMRHTGMTELPYEPLLQLTINRRLDRLLLKNNHLKSLDQKYDRIFEALQDFEINQNPWHCDCGLTWLIRRYRAMLDKRTQGYQQRLQRRDMLNTWVEEENQPKCATPLGLFGRNFTDLITDINNVYSTSAAIHGPQTVMYCPSPQLQSLELNLENYHQNVTQHLSTSSISSVNLQCVIKGSKYLKVLWRFYSPEHGYQRVSSANSTTVMLPITPHQNIWTTETDDTMQTHSTMRIQQNGLIDTYSCLGEDIVGNVSSVFRIRWPPGISAPIKDTIPITSTLATSTTPRSATVHGAAIDATWLDLRAPRFSLSEMLAAIVGTICCTILMFFVIHWLRHFRIWSCTYNKKQTTDKLHAVDDGPLGVSPAGTSSSNTSSSNAKLITPQTLTESYPVHVYNRDALPAIVSNQIPYVSTYHPYFTGTGNLNQPTRDLHPHMMGRLPEVGTDPNMSSSSAYEPIAYSDANNPNTTYDAPWLFTNMRQNGDQHVPLLFNPHAQMTNSGLVLPSHHPTTLNIPPPPLIPQPSLPATPDSTGLHDNLSVNQGSTRLPNSFVSQTGYTMGTPLQTGVLLHVHDQTNLRSGYPNVS